MTESEESIMTDNDIPFRRLLRQRIAEEARFDKPEDVVRHLGAVQAQDYHQAVWAIASRTKDAKLADVERAIEERRIVLSWPMRGTIHAVPPEELRSMLRLLAPRRLAQDKRRMEQLELSEAIVERCSRLVQDELGGGKRLTRDDLMRLFEEAGIGTAGQRGYHLIWRLAQAGVLCLGPRDGKQQTFVLADEWLPPEAGEPEKDEALARLAIRYFEGHGPATDRDFAWWTGLTLTEARQAIEAARDRLIPNKLESREFREAAEPASAGRLAVEEEFEDSVYLLAGFDEYLLGYADRSDVLPEAVFPYVVPGNNGVFMPLVVIGGRIAGLWKRKPKARSIDFEFRLAGPAQPYRDRLIREAERYCAFHGLALGQAEFRSLEETR